MPADGPDGPGPPKLICLDEPELGLHPALMSVLAGLIKMAGDRTQVVVTTHSPQLISCFRPEQVAVIEKEQGATRIRRFSAEGELAQWLEHYSLGELWLRGHIGGRP